MKNGEFKNALEPIQTMMKQGLYREAHKRAVRTIVQNERDLTAMQRNALECIEKESLRKTMWAK